jgi:hypothetical protein
MATITNPQIQKLHCLYRNLNIGNKEEMLLHITNGRTDSTAGLTKYEATRLITTLVGDGEAEKLRKTIFSLAYDAGIIYGDTEIDKKLNRAKLDMFLVERGTVKKNINTMAVFELKQVIRQFKAIVKSNAATKDNKQAKAATDALLNELNITIQQ